MRGFQGTFKLPDPPGMEEHHFGFKGSSLAFVEPHVEQSRHSEISFFNFRFKELKINKIFH